jgi:hypothetical protein
VSDETSRCEHYREMEVYLHTFSTSIFHAREISFMARPLCPSGLHNAGEHRRLALARKRTPNSHMSEEDTETKTTHDVPYSTVAESERCRHRTAPGGQAHILGPARRTGGISLSQLHISFRRLVVQFSHSARTFVRRHRISSLIHWTVTNDSTEHPFGDQNCLAHVMGTNLCV